jgi:hypothetical protein
LGSSGAGLFSVVRDHEKTEEDEEGVVMIEDDDDDDDEEEVEVGGFAAAEASVSADRFGTGTSLLDLERDLALLTSC